MEEETACTQSEGCFPSVTSLFIQGTMLVNVATSPEKLVQLIQQCRVPLAMLLGETLKTAIYFYPN